MHRTMIRSSLPKAFGVRWGALADRTTWEPLTPAMLRLLVAIAEAEKRLAAGRAAQEAGVSAAAAGSEHHASA